MELRLSDGDSLPVGDGVFDAVFANMYLHHAPDPAAAIIELARVLKPGGGWYSQIWINTTTIGCVQRWPTCGTASRAPK